MTPPFFRVVPPCMTAVIGDNIDMKTSNVPTHQRKGRRLPPKCALQRRYAGPPHASRALREPDSVQPRHVHIGGSLSFSLALFSLRFLLTVCSAQASKNEPDPGCHHDGSFWSRKQKMETMNIELSLVDFNRVLCLEVFHLNAALQLACQVARQEGVEDERDRIGQVHRKRL